MTVNEPDVPLHMTSETETVRLWAQIAVDRSREIDELRDTLKRIDEMVLEEAPAESIHELISEALDAK
jgi:hypothetical protein